MQLGSLTLTTWPTTCADAGHKLQFNSGGWICGCEFGFTAVGSSCIETAPTPSGGGSNASVSTISVDTYGATVVSSAALITGALAVTGTTALTSDLNVNSGKLTVAAATGNTAVAGTLAVAGATALAGDLSVNGNKLTVAAASGNAALAGTLAVTGATTLAGDLNVNSGKFTVAAASGNAVVAGNLTVNGPGLTAGGTLSVSGAAVLGSTLNVAGAATLRTLTVGGSSVTAPPTCAGVGAALQYNASGWYCTCVFTGAAWTAGCALPSSGVPAPPSCLDGFMLKYNASNATSVWSCARVVQAVSGFGFVDGAYGMQCTGDRFLQWNPEYSGSFPGVWSPWACTAGPSSPPVCNATNSQGLLYVNSPSSQYVCKCNAGYANALVTKPTNWPGPMTYTNPGDCSVCLPGYNPATNCVQCLPGYDSATQCTTCLSPAVMDPQGVCVCPGATPGTFNYALTAPTCAYSCRYSYGYDASTSCTTCIAGVQAITIPASDSRTLTTSGCTQCAAGFDPATGCTQCIDPGKTTASNCQTCTTGTELATTLSPPRCLCSGATAGTFNYLLSPPMCAWPRWSGYNVSTGYTTCNDAYDPINPPPTDYTTLQTSGCSQCANPLFSASTGCVRCVDPGKNASTGCTTCYAGLELDTTSNPPRCFCPGSRPGEVNYGLAVSKYYYDVMSGLGSWVADCGKCVLPTYDIASDCTTCVTVPSNTVNANTYAPITLATLSQRDPQGCGCVNSAMNASLLCACRNNYPVNLPSSPYYQYATVTGNNYMNMYSCGCGPGPTAPTYIVPPMLRYSLYTGLDPNPANGAPPCSVCKAGYTLTSSAGQEPPICEMSNYGGG